MLPHRYDILFNLGVTMTCSPSSIQNLIKVTKDLKKQIDTCMCYYDVHFVRSWENKSLMAFHARSLSLSPLPTNQGAPFPRPGLMRSRSTIAGATSDIGVCSRPHGGQGSFCEPSQARLSSGVTEAMLVGTGSSVQTSGTGQCECVFLCPLPLENHKFL